jgi:hypothetical protein
MYIYTIQDCIFGDFLAENHCKCTVHTLVMANINHYNKAKTSKKQMTALLVTARPCPHLS